MQTVAWIDAIDGAALLRLLTMAPLTYAALVITLRIAGKRTLAKLNAFDLVVTVALGSTLSSALLSRDVSLAQGVTALILLVLLQFAVAWSSVRLSWMRRITRSEPSVLFEDGTFHHDRMRQERVTEAEVRQAIRASGIGCVEHVSAVVLETDGTLSVVNASHAGELTRADLG